jgi:hypothetical protein
MYLKKQDLDELNWKQLHSMTTTELEEFAQTHLIAHQQWLLPQIVANFGKWTLVYDGSKPNIQQTLAKNVGQDPKQQVLWRITRIPRSVLVRSQTNYPQYATLTPLILAGFKQYQGIGYETFRGCANLEWLVEPKLLEAMAVACPGLGSDKLLEIRNHGLMNKTGLKAGTLKPAETTWSLTGVKDTEIGHLPKLTQTMLTQIWLAHPAKRTQLMVLDPQNWDNMPEPLIKVELFESTNKAVEQFKSQKHDKLLPWL